VKSGVKGVTQTRSNWKFNCQLQKCPLTKNFPLNEEGLKRAVALSRNHWKS
jgi:hypothetical protein